MYVIVFEFYIFIIISFWGIVISVISIVVIYSYIFVGVDDCFILNGKGNGNNNSCICCYNRYNNV